MVPTKAVQCARLAQDASEPDRRTSYEEEKTWRQMADQIEANEEPDWRRLQVKDAG
jgi:hypothetical protein